MSLNGPYHVYVHVAFISELLCNGHRPFKQRMYFVKSHSLLNSAVTYNGPDGLAYGPTEFTHNDNNIIVTGFTIITIILFHYEFKWLAAKRKPLGPVPYMYMWLISEAQAVRPGPVYVYVAYQRTIMYWTRA